MVLFSTSCEPFFGVCINPPFSERRSDTVPVRSPECESRFARMWPACGGLRLEPAAGRRCRTSQSGRRFRPRGALLIPQRAGRGYSLSDLSCIGVKFVENDAMKGVTDASRAK